jgi:hypothetical protein
MLPLGDAEDARWVSRHLSTIRLFAGFAFSSACALVSIRIRAAFTSCGADANSGVSVMLDGFGAAALEEPPALDELDVAVIPASMLGRACAALKGLFAFPVFLAALPKGGIALDAAPSSNGSCIPPLDAAKLCIALDADIGPDVGPDVDVANGIGPRPILPIEVLAPSIPLPIAELVARAPLAIPEAAALAPLRIAVPATPAPVAIPEPAARTPVPIAVPTVLAPLPIALAAMPAPPAITVPAVLSPVFLANPLSPSG